MPTEPADPAARTAGGALPPVSMTPPAPASPPSAATPRRAWYSALRAVALLLRRAPLLKTVTAVTAVLSLGLLVRQIVGNVEAARARQRAADELVRGGEIESSARSYASAWRLLDSANRLEPNDARARAAREALAMAWLEDARVSEGESFESVTTPVVPVLTAAVARARGRYRADLLAHVGWAQFLVDRYGERHLDARGTLGRALEDDPENTYAHSMLGLLDSWTAPDVVSAQRHFARALATGRAHAWVRSMQRSALQNALEHDGDGAAAEVLRTANALRVGNERASDDWRQLVTDVYFAHLRDRAELTRLLRDVPPDDALATFRWAFASHPFNGDPFQHELVTAMLEENAGRRDSALARYRRLQTSARRSLYRDQAREGIRRLSGNDGIAR